MLSSTLRRISVPALFVSSLLLGLSGCGGGDSTQDTGGSGGASVTVSGTATKGPVASATVKLSNPVDGSVLATVTTDANGNWTANIPSGIAPVWVSVSGGSYVDEATGQTITVPVSTTGIEILAALFDPAQQTAVPVTPITTALAKTAEWSAIDRTSAPLSSASLSAALQDAITQYTAAFGFNPMTTMPTADLANATAVQKLYQAVLGGFSKLANDLLTNGRATDPALTMADALQALVFDFAADGKFDGKGYGGRDMKFGSANTALVSASLPTTVGVTALSNAITQYLAGPRAPTQLAGITVNLQVPNFTGLFPGGFAGGATGGGTAAPTITSFTPTSGAVGTTVTITGTNFSATAANNIVRFNGTLATVTSATTTSLTVTVPAGATTGPISVTTAGGTASSTTNFTVSTGTGGSGGAGGTNPPPNFANPGAGGGANNWVSRTSGTTSRLNAVTSSGTQFVAVGDTQASGTILTSPDGVTWTTRSSGMTNTPWGVTWSGTQFVVVGGNWASGTILTSPDGVTWTTRSSGTMNTLRAVTWSGTQFVAVGDWGTILTSPDGVTWTTRSSGTTQPLRDVTWSGTQFVVVDSGGTILTSPDGVTWTTRSSGTTNGLQAVIWSGDKFVAVGFNGTILTSPDGATWTLQTSGTAQPLNGVTWSGSQFVAVGWSGTILTSPDGVAWTPRPSGTTNYLSSVAWSGSQFVAVGDSGTILTSP